MSNIHKLAMPLLAAASLVLVAFCVLSATDSDMAAVRATTARDVAAAR